MKISETLLKPICYQPIFITGDTVGNKLTQAEENNHLLCLEEQLRKKFLNIYFEYHNSFDGMGGRWIPEIKEFNYQTNIVTKVINYLLEHHLKNDNSNKDENRFLIWLSSYLHLGYFDANSYLYLCNFYDTLDVDDRWKNDDLPRILANIDFQKLPDLRGRVKLSFENAFLEMKDFSEEYDTMFHGITDVYEKQKKIAHYKQATKNQNTEIGLDGFKDNQGQKLTQSYYQLVRFYANMMEGKKDECIDFLLLLMKQWTQMSVRLHAFEKFKELTNDVQYADRIAYLVVNEEEMDTRNLMLSWLKTVDYSNNAEILSVVKKTAEQLFENPCFSRVPLYIGNDDAIPDVRNAAKELLAL